MTEIAVLITDQKNNSRSFTSWTTPEMFGDSAVIVIFKLDFTQAMC